MNNELNTRTPDDVAQTEAPMANTDAAESLGLDAQPAVAPARAGVQSPLAHNAQSDMDAQDAHREYLQEARLLIDRQTDALFAEVERALAATSGQQAQTQRGEHTLTVTCGDRSVEFAVEAITDLPEGAERAHDFETGQARCTVRGADGSTDVWVLHRLGVGASSPTYTWMRFRSETPIQHEEIVAVLQPLFQ